MDINLLEKSILEKLPQIGFIVDQVGLAMKFSKEEQSEGDYIKTLKGTLKVAEYASKVSENNFFKYHLVIASLIGDIPGITNSEKFEVFKTASGSVEDTIKHTLIGDNLIKERGCFKATSIHLVPLSKENQDYFACMMCHILADLEDIVAGMKKVNVKSPITPSDYVTILGYSYVMQNVLASASIIGATAEITNSIQILLNDLVY